MIAAAPGLHPETRVWFDGTLTEPRLDHPECVAVHPDGSLWCGGERGQIFRLDPDGGLLREVASTGGFSLGLAFDAQERLYICDLKAACVFRLDTQTGRLERFAEGAGARRLRTRWACPLRAGGAHPARVR